MDEIKEVFARRLSHLRTTQGWTQLELAEKLNYSDKAVSKWERGESVPDVSVLLQISRLFGVSVDSLITDDPTAPPLDPRAFLLHNRGLVTALSVLCVWAVATLTFVVLNMCNVALDWLCFIAAVPVSFIVWLIFNSMWFARRTNFLIISLLMWSVLGCAYVIGLTAGVSIGLLFLLGIPGQIIILLWSFIKYRKNKIAV